MWTEEAIKAELDGTFTKVSCYGKVTTHRVPDPDSVPEYKFKAPQARGFKHIHPYRYWTPDQDKELVDLRAIGWSYKQIGERMGRTADAIHNRLYKLEDRT